jgi:hypothetical protein
MTFPSCVALTAAAAFGFATPALAAQNKIEAADTAFMIAATALCCSSVARHCHRRARRQLVLLSERDFEAEARI